MKYRFVPLFLTFTFLTLLTASAQEAEAEKKEPEYGWKKQIVGSLNLTQTNFDNWTQGGENSLSWQLNLDASFINDQEKFNWSNTGKISFGQIKVGDASSRKSVDELKLETVYTRKFGFFMEPYAGFRAETQLAKGYNYDVDPKVAISNFVDPAYFTFSLGVGHSEDETFKTRLGAALRYTLTDKYNQYADDAGTAKIEDTRTESGIESVTEVNVHLLENTLLKSNLNLFSNLKQFRQVIVKWDTVISAKVNEYISANFNFQLYYDHNISDQRQIKQALSLGLTYNLL